jgi:hypothetical protein
VSGAGTWARAKQDWRLGRGHKVADGQRVGQDGAARMSRWGSQQFAGGGVRAGHGCGRRERDEDGSATLASVQSRIRALELDRRSSFLAETQRQEDLSIACHHQANGCSEGTLAPPPHAVPSNASRLPPRLCLCRGAMP